ncbi:MAG: phage holin family protein [Peptoniphilus harei]|uniref:phage holin family protein n=1 Tax=uncultured Peptoniphilus sp. TaxID=254354 RepID=UPI0025885DF2|nr:phage holin family protein [uncultured Peptoniphilus sp.]MDU5467243.1 phage holin family protein [Peptoniphilus harei]MDU6783878.1 phage holin family protein [Peptoniphilus harei]
MIKLIIKILISGLAILITSALSIGIQTDGYTTAIMAAVVIGILDWAINKFTGVDASPFGRGAVGFVVAAIILFITGQIVDGFTVSILGAIIGALILGIVDSFLPADKKTM